MVQGKNSAQQVTAKTLGTRNRRVQSEYRKQQIIDATITCIDRSGLSHLTLDKVAEEAGITKGNVVFHFGNRDNLLEKTLEYLNNEYLDCWQSLLETAGDDPVKQLKALIDARFHARICSRKKVSLWYAFWGETRARPSYLKVCAGSDASYSKALLQCCEMLSGRYHSSLDASTAALAIEGMIDGLWQDMLISPKSRKRDQAANAVFRLATALFPGLGQGLA